MPIDLKFRKQVQNILSPLMHRGLSIVEEEYYPDHEGAAYAVLKSDDFRLYLYREAQARGGGPVFIMIQPHFAKDRDWLPVGVMLTDLGFPVWDADAHKVASLLEEHYEVMSDILKDPKKWSAFEDAFLRQREDEARARYPETFRLHENLRPPRAQPEV